MGGESSTPEANHKYNKITTDSKDFTKLLSETHRDFSILEKTTLDIAVTGISYAGKSSLINALRGLSDFDEGAAQIDVIQVIKDPQGYPHPQFPNVILWDLPGNGTCMFSVEKYLERVNYSRYDFFILVASERFTFRDIELSCAIQKMGKRLYYVRSKIDVSIYFEPDFKEEVILQNIRKYCLRKLVQAGIFSPEIFLVSSWYRDKYDFPLLQRTLENEMEDFERRALIAEKEKLERPTESSRKAMGGNNSTPVVSCEPEKERSVREGGGKTILHIAISGVTGAGKSSLVNALRGLSDFDEDAAETDVIEGTKEPMGYPHPAFPDVRIWDLPGIGTPNFNAKEYLDKVNYSQYDFFIIVASHRFTVYDIQLSHEVQKMKKRFYYVRSKMDVSISSEKLNPNFNEEAIIQKVKRDCLSNLEQAGISSPQIFLISSWYRDKYDFPLLQRTLENEMEDFERCALIAEKEKLERPTESSRKAMGQNDSTPVVSCEPEKERSVREGGGKTTLDIAISGVKGAGKSSLVNALRGLSDFDKDAAETGVIGTKEPMGYPHPVFPDVTIWDLPGIGTPDCKAKEYLEKVNYSKYDFFIIVASHRFTIYDIQLSQEVQKMKKRFYYVRSKMDVSIRSEKRNPDFNEEAIIQNVKRDCLSNLEQAGISSPQIFLISSWYQDKYDFLLLQRTLGNEIEALRRRVLRPAEPPNSGNKRDDKSTNTSKGSGIRFIPLPNILKMGLVKLKDALMQRNLEEVTEEIRRQLDALENVKLDIAITGVSGAGKSSLVNALRGMADVEDGAAKVGKIQTTKKCQAYPHPLFPNVTIWDLPGIGTPEFRPKDYLEKVNFSQYDFFMIVASERFTENDVLLASEIKKMEKKFYFVRSKMDISMASEIRRSNFNMENSIRKIRKYCCDNLRERGESNPRVFLISRRDLNKYDFPSLQEALENDLDDLKREALILAMPLFSRKMLEKKQAKMQDFIWKLALMSCAVGAIPVPGLSVCCNISILVTGVIRFYKVFCLDEDSLNRVAKAVDKDCQTLQSAIKKSPMSSKITQEFVISLLARSLLCTVLAVVNIVLYFIPVLGSLVGGASSFLTTYYMLGSFLNDIVEDSENVRAKAAEP